MQASRFLFIPVILGTVRMGRMSLHVARLVTQEVAKHAGVETELIDVALLPLPTDDAGEAIKDSGYSAEDGAGRRFDHRSAGIQPRLFRFVEARS